MCWVWVILALLGWVSAWRWHGRAVALEGERDRLAMEAKQLRGLIAMLARRQQDGGTTMGGSHGVRN